MYNTHVTSGLKNFGQRRMLYTINLNFIEVVLFVKQFTTDIFFLQ